MSQKSILSFFKSSDQTTSSSGTKKKQVIEDSPVKTKRNKRKVKCIESDDESLDSSSKSLNGDSGQKIEDNNSKKTKLSNQSPPKVSGKEKNEKKVNGVSTSKRSPKQKKVEEKEASESTSKDEANMSDIKQECSENGKSEDSLVKAPASSDSEQVECIPKRKTARKQMKSARNTKRNGILQKVKEKSDSNLLDGDKDGKRDTNDNTTSQNDDLDVEMKEIEIPSSSEEAKESPALCDEMDSEKDPESKKLSDNTEKSPDTKLKGRKSKGKNSPVKKPAKTESIHSFFTPLKKSEEDKNEKKVDNEDKKMVDEEDEKMVDKKNNEKKLDKKDNKKKVDKEDKKKVDKKNNEKKVDKEDNEKKEDKKDNEKKVDKKGNSKKSKFADKKETKAKEDNKKNSEEGSKKSRKAEIDDSPVKRVSKRKKKIQSLESDDEDDKDQSVSPEGHVKMETDDIEENSDESSEKNKENSDNGSEVPINTESKEKESPCKKSEDADPKRNKEKQKFAVKSTSASGTVYNPSKNHYHPIEDAFWKKDEKVPYLALAKTLELIENTSGRLKTIEILANFLRSVIVLSPDDFLQSVYLCLNRIAPEYEGIELGVGETLLMKAVAQATGRTLEKIKAEVAAKGDLGLVSESSRGNQRVMFAPPKLTISSVFSKFFEIAKMSGNSAMTKKVDKIQSLFVACRDCEARYIIRSLSGKLRIGLAEQSILSAIARAVVQTPPAQAYPPEVIDASKKLSSDSFKEIVDSQALILKTAYCECPNYDLIIPVLLKEGISALPERCQLAPGRPLKPMLAHPTAGIDKVLERFDKNAFTCEFKYDGERAQIHMTDTGDVKIFSRNQEDNTSKYPDVISRISNALKENTKSFILDSEAVAWDKASKQILPFQVLSTRKRKDAVESEIVVQVCIMAFDLLYLNGESLVKKPLKERRNLLHSFFEEVENEFMFAQYKDGNSAETMQEFLDESVRGNCEGLMVKSLEVDASYEIAKRSHNWLKLKKDYLQGIGDTLDLVVIGGYYGKGKRTGNYGGFLLACYDEENEEFQCICKLGTGFKDETLETHTTFLKQHVIKEPKSYFRYDHSLEPDEWFEPVQVWEIKCADLSISPVHKAAIGIIDPEKGISLRFPRFIRIRDDKTPENATNSVQIADMYQKQQQIQNTSNKNSKVEEDYY